LAQCFSPGARSSFIAKRNARGSQSHPRRPIFPRSVTAVSGGRIWKTFAETRSLAPQGESRQEDFIADGLRDSFTAIDRRVRIELNRMPQLLFELALGG